MLRLFWEAAYGLHPNHQREHRQGAYLLRDVRQAEPCKKEWLKQRFAEGLVFYRSVERGKCFIEYIPAENAWVPITADGWLYINCLWVSGAMKGNGCSNDLLEKCLSDAKAQGKKASAFCAPRDASGNFSPTPSFCPTKGFEIADVSDCGITLMCLPLNADTALPKFKDCARHPKAEGEGFVLYYTDQCPFTYYWVPKGTAGRAGA